jgi:ketosteroid isomerase-like protein
VNKRSFPTPQDAEAAFYEALEANDIEAMMEVWAEDEEIVCVHPGGPRIAGYDQVRESWTRILGSGQTLKVQLTDQVYVQSVMLSIHSLHENIAVGGDAGRQRPVVTTNVYVRQGGGWRMVAHHASAGPQAPRAPAPDSPKTLH